MRLWCFPFTHDYKCITVSYYRDTSWNNKKGIPSTQINYRCKSCGEFKTEHVYGAVLTKEQINGGK